MIRPPGSLLVPLAAALALAVSAAGAREVKDDPHGELRGDCGLCHGPDAWSPLRLDADFDHENFGGPLEGAHDRVDCRACHASLDFRETPTECADCHQDVHRGEMGAECSRCHTTRSFTSRAEMARNHQLTRFPLHGAHLALECDACHRAGGGDRAYLLPTGCHGCHRSEFLATTDPDHQAGGFSTACEDCHTTRGWDHPRFDHGATRFPVVGAHRALACRDCHRDGAYAGTSPECVSCHRAEYDTTTDPDHRQAGYSTECALCHSMARWAGATSNHGLTLFPLTGAHRTLDCQACHADGVYGGRSTDCFSCHQDDFGQTADPNHQASGFSTDCAACHDTTSWNNATFDHDGLYFPIYSGRHAGRWQACSDCHPDSSSYADFTCLQCHEHSDENEVTGQHSEVSGFRYDSLACYSCHPDGRH